MDTKNEQLKAALENAQFNERAEKLEAVIADLLKEVRISSIYSLHLHILDALFATVHSLNIGHDRCTDKGGYVR